MLKLLTLLFCCVLISACATMNESECITADWRMVGYEDGTQGRTSSMLTNRREACAKHGVTPRMDDYRLGYDEGLLEFCTEFNGFQKGSQGYDYQGICRGSGESEFIDGYREGQHLYSLRQSANQVRQRLDSSRYEVKRLNKKVLKLRDRVVSDKSTPEERAKFLDRIRDMEHEIGALEANIDADLYLLVLAEHEYEDFKQSLPY